MDWKGVSEINAGLVLLGKRSAHEYDPDDLFPPYDDVIKVYKEKPDALKEDVVLKVHPTAIQIAIHAAENLNGMGESTNWPEILRKQASLYRLGKQLKRTGERLERGDDADLLSLSGKLQALSDDSQVGLVRADDVDYDAFEPFEPSGWGVNDNILGGVPKYGLQIVYGRTGVGKSFWLAKRIKEFLRHYPERTAAVYTLEMPDDEYLHRSIHMYPDLKEFSDRLYVNGMVTRVEDILAECSTHKIDFVGIDFVDHLVKDDSPSEYAKVYKKIVQMGRLLRIPITLLAQPNRASMYNNERFLTMHDIAWSSMAENSAWQLIALQRANELDMEDDLFPLFDDDHYYMICWKQRGGWPKQKGPGAIILEPSPTLWEGKPVKNRLWNPGAVRKMKRRKRKE